jgi:hypothetical protein
MDWVLRGENMARKGKKGRNQTDIANIFIL